MRLEVSAAQEVALTLAILRKSAFEQPDSVGAGRFGAAFFASRHLIEFRPPLADMAAGSQAWQFERIAAREGDFRHLFGGDRTGRCGQQRHHACDEKMR